MNSAELTPIGSLLTSFQFTLQECFTACKLEQHKMRSRMNQALLSNNQGTGDESDRVNELVENYLKKNTELYDIENLIPVSLSFFFFS